MIELPLAREQERRRLIDTFYARHINARCTQRYAATAMPHVAVLTIQHLCRQCRLLLIPCRVDDMIELPLPQEQERRRLIDMFYARHIDAHCTQRHAAGQHGHAVVATAAAPNWHGAGSGRGRGAVVPMWLRREPVQVGQGLC